MLDFEDFLRFIKSQDFYSNQIVHVESFPELKARFGELDFSLNKRIKRWLEQNDIKLWRHQAEAINHIWKGRNTVTVTSTSSGKSLIYNISVINSLLNDEKMTALYVFPTKALARDQYHVLLNIFKEMRIKQSRIGVYDGDIESNVKRLVLANANIIITNPYGLHYYLPWFKQKWRRFCQYLKYVILDEIHVYRGIFGSNFAFLIRRLKRILKQFNSHPIWILSSATINNPKSFSEKLVGEEFIVVDEDDSPSGEKKVILWDLPYDESSGKYRSPHQETKNLFLAHLKYKGGIQTLTFTVSRKMAELQAMWAKKALPTLKNRICSYRAGISKEKRREIEIKFKKREILGVSSTNALELGIDIGSLEATICSGFPGTISSFRQQIGRSGRGSSLSISTLIPMQDPLDIFYVHNPEILFGPNTENLLITLSNKYILKNHICCAAKEHPILLEDHELFNVNQDLFQECLMELTNESLLMKRGNKYYWIGSYFPNEKISLNSLSNKMYKVILVKEHTEELLTVEDESYVFRDLHPGAVYLYEAETYIVKDLDLINKKVYIEKKNVDYYTQSLKHTDILPIEIIQQYNMGDEPKIEVFYGNVKVEHEYFAYKVINSLTQEVITRQPLEDLPIVEFETKAFWYTIPFEFQKELESNDFDLGGSIHAVEHAMIAIAPVLAQISRWDLGGLSIEFDPVKQQPIIYIYDAYRGGIGISEQLFHDLKQLLNLTHTLINSCNCKTPNGCPACIMSPRCGNQNEPLDKQGALFLLKKLLSIV